MAEAYAQPPTDKAKTKPPTKTEYEGLFQQARGYIREKELTQFSNMYRSSNKTEAQAARMAVTWAQKDREDISFFIPFLRKMAIEEGAHGGLVAASALGTYYLNKEGSMDGTVRALMGIYSKNGKYDAVQGLREACVAWELERQKKKDEGN